MLAPSGLCVAALVAAVFATDEHAPLPGSPAQAAEHARHQVGREWADNPSARI
jgi:hypothetical protein